MKRYRSGWVSLTALIWESLQIGVLEVQLHKYRVRWLRQEISCSMNGSLDAIRDLAQSQADDDTIERSVKSGRTLALRHLAISCQRVRPKAVALRIGLFGNRTWITRSLWNILLHKGLGLVCRELKQRLALGNSMSGKDVGLTLNLFIQQSCERRVRLHV